MDGKGPKPFYFLVSISVSNSYILFVYNIL
nr:MAG TPA: hypothetical protein [Caudoviricetes sp.]